MKPSTVGWVAGGAAVLLGGAYLMGRRQRAASEPPDYSNPISRGADTIVRGTEMMLGGDGLSEVSGEPTTVGSALYDAQQAARRGLNPMNEGNVVNRAVMGALRLVGIAGDEDSNLYDVVSRPPEASQLPPSTRGELLEQHSGGGTSVAPLPEGKWWM